MLSSQEIDDIVNAHIKHFGDFDDSTVRITDRLSQGKIIEVVGSPVDDADPIGTDKHAFIHHPVSSYEDQIMSQELLETGVKKLLWPNEQYYTSISSIERMSRMFARTPRKVDQATETFTQTSSKNSPV